VPKAITVTSVDQIVQKDMRIADLETRPEHILRWFSNNILRRMLGYLVGWTGIEYKLLRCDTDGILEVKSVGGKYTMVQTAAGNAATAWGVGIIFTTLTKEVMIQIWDYPVYVKFSSDGVNFSQEIELSADMIYGFEWKAFNIYIKNKVAGQVGRFEFAGSW